jgi:hypothetical protein
LRPDLSSPRATGEDTESLPLEREDSNGGTRDGFNSVIMAPVGVLGILLFLVGLLVFLAKNPETLTITVSRAGPSRAWRAR